MEIVREKGKNVVENSASCEKSRTCKGASVACFESVFTPTMPCDPSKRWMYCYEWKKKLGLVFDKELGVYILPETKDLLMERAKGKKNKIFGVFMDDEVR